MKYIKLKKVMMNILVLMIPMCSNMGNVQAQTQTLVVTLKECIEYGLENNRSTTVFTNQVAIAKQKSVEALSAYLPQANGTVTLDDNIKLQTTLIPAGELSPTPLRVTLGNPFASNMVVRVDQTIYDNTLITGLKANKPNIEVAQLQKEQNDVNLISDIAKTYYQIVTLQEQEKLLIQNEKRYTEILNTLQMQYDKGVIKKNDYDRMKVNLNNTIAQKTYTQTNILLVTNRLKYAMGLDMAISITLADSISGMSEHPVLPVEKREINNRIDYKIQLQNLTLQEIDLKRKHASAYPVLTSYAQYGVLGYGTTIDKMMNPNQQFNYAAIGLKLNVPLFSGWKRTSQIRQSAILLANAKENLKLNESNYALEIQNYSTQLLKSYTTLQTNKNNLDLARDVFSTTSFQYQNGTANLSDLLNSDYSYKEAQTNYLTSLFDYLATRIDLEKSIGTLKQYANQL